MMYTKHEILEFLTAFYFVMNANYMQGFDDRILKVRRAVESLSKQDLKFRYVLGLVKDIDKHKEGRKIENMEERFLNACSLLRE